MIEEILINNADKGFAYAVSIFLLWKGWTQDKEYLTVLTQLKTAMEAHVKSKDEAIDLLKNGR